MESEEAGIIEGPAPVQPQRRGLGWFLVEEGAWLLLAVAITILAASSLQGRGGGFAAAAPGVALFGLHGLVGAHVVRTERSKLAGWFRVNRSVALWGVGGGAFLLAFNGLYGLALDALGVVPPDVAAMLRGLLPESALIAWAAVLAPLVEEMYFRGRLLDALASKLGPGWSGAATSLAFAVIHWVPEFFPAYLVFAFALLVLRRRTGGLAAPVLAHMINNAVVLFE